MTERRWTLASGMTLSALEFAWMRQPVDGGFALWMAAQAIERQGRGLESLRP